MIYFKDVWFLSIAMMLVYQSISFDGKFSYEPRREQDKGKKHILLLGASIGKSWNIPTLPQRMDNYKFIFEYVHGGAFNKTESLKKIIERRKNRPDVIIIKECAAYFPGDINEYKKLVKSWVEDCLAVNIIPVLTTVIPVTRLNSFKQVFIDIIKSRNPLRFGNPFKFSRNKVILLYNDWVKVFSNENSIACLDLESAVRYSKKNRFLRECLDLESAVRYSKKNRFLREDLAKIDGLHLNRKAYNILDKVLIEIVEQTITTK